VARIVIGCGGTLSGDDGVGPAVIAALSSMALPAGTRCLDAGTAGIDAALVMAGTERVILVDACRSDAPPGTLRELADLDPAACRAPAGIDLHRCRWDQALALARLAWGTRAPGRIDVVLVEGEAFTPGSDLSPAVRRAVGPAAARVVELLTEEPGAGKVPASPPDDAVARGAAAGHPGAGG